MTTDQGTFVVGPSSFVASLASAQSLMSPDPHCSKIDPALLAQAAADPSASVSAIVRTVGLAAPRRAAAEGFGLTVRHVYRLWPGLAVQGPVSALLTLVEEPWVQAIEVDREVKAMKGDNGSVMA